MSQISPPHRADGPPYAERSSVSPSPAPPVTPSPSPWSEPSRSRSSGMSLRDSLGTVTAVAAVFAIATYILSYACSWFWLAELFTHFRVQLLGVFVILVLLLAALRYWRWAALTGAILLWTAWPVAREVWPSAPSAPPPPSNTSVLKLLSANVLFYNRNFEPLERLVADEQPDVLVVIECTEAWRERLRGLESEYPYTITEPRSHGFGIGLWSKRPLRNPRAAMLSAADAPALFAEVDVGGESVQLAAVHLMSPLDPRRFAERNLQLEGLAESLNRWPGPRLVLGDFNAAPWSPYLARFLRESDLQDSRIGFGVQPSWPQQIPLLRIPIDHLFVSRGLVVHERRLGPPIGSDHRPVIATISVRPGE